MAGEVSVGLYTGSVGEIAKSKGVAKKVVRLHLAVSNGSEIQNHITNPYVTYKCTT